MNSPCSSTRRSPKKPTLGSATIVPLSVWPGTALSVVDPGGAIQIAPASVGRWRGAPSSCGLLYASVREPSAFTYRPWRMSAAGAGFWSSSVVSCSATAFEAAGPTASLSSEWLWPLGSVLQSGAVNVGGSYTKDQ